MAITFQRILIVEDEPIVRMYEAELAANAGFMTVEANNASDALAKLESGDTIHILLTDIDMPGPVDGLSLANMVSERWPDIKIVVVSAYVDTEAPAPNGISYLHKPFTERGLMTALLDLV